MIDCTYYRGFEGERAYRVFASPEDGMMVWAGYFDAFLTGCFRKPAATGGTIEAWAIGDVLYDQQIWEISDLALAIQELGLYDEKRLNGYEWAAPKMEEFGKALKALFCDALQNNETVKIEMF